MNCELFQPAVAELARRANNGLVDAGVWAAAEAHAAECERCAQALFEQSELSEALRGLSDQVKGLSAPAELEGQLLAAFRAQAGVAAINSHRPNRRYWVAAIAAMVLVAFATWGLWARRESGPPGIEQVKQAQLKSPSSAVNNLPIQKAIDVVQTPPFKGGKRSSLHRTSLKSKSKPVDAAPVIAAAKVATLPSAEVESQEIATDFVPVGYGSALDLRDGGQLMRVELTRFALARFGLPMNMDRADEPVKADVWVGVDGLAKAIRFVN
jgi:hypothetical protein